jgi:hypothetical protein
MWRRLAWLESAKATVLSSHTCSLGLMASSFRRQERTARQDQIMSYKSGTFRFLPLIIHRHVAVKKWLHDPTYPERSSIPEVSALYFTCLDVPNGIFPLLYSRRNIFLQGVLPQYRSYIARMDFSRYESPTAAHSTLTHHIPQERTPTSKIC